ncbi:Hypothetical predicted protein, partial [Mytilus galloprovincialis]
CVAGRYGKDCLVPCLPYYHGVQCKLRYNCTHNQKCDSVQGCVCKEGFNALDGNCTNDCHQGFYNISYNFNCSETCICRNETFCNPRSGICEYSDETLCKNITKKPTPKNPTDRQSVPVITLVNVSAIGMPMLLFTCLLLIKHCKHQFQHSPKDSEAISDQTYGNDIYCEINIEQLKDQTSVNSLGTGNFNTEKNCQQTTEENHRHINIAKSLPNFLMYEEQYLNPYCSL